MSSLRDAVRSPRPMLRTLVLHGLLQWAILSQLSAVPTNAATAYQSNGRKMGEMEELEGSIARFRQLITQDEFSFRSLLQVDEKKSEEHHEDVGQGQTAEPEVNEHKKNEENTVEEQTQSESNVKQPNRHVDEKNIVEGERQIEENLNETPDLVYFEKTDEQQQQEKTIEGREGENKEERKPQEQLREKQQVSEDEEQQSNNVVQKVSEDERTEEKEQQQREEEQNSSEEGMAEEKEPQPKTKEEHQEKDKQNQADDQNNNEEEKKEEDPFVFPEPYLLGPTIKDWDEQRQSWLNANPQMKTTPDGKPRVLIVTGSQPGPCHSSSGDNFHLKALKLKIDYARMHKYEIYYNLAWLDPLFGSFWVKLPTIRTLMLTHPEIEWFFWVDSDATFTDMLFEPPWETYEGYNMIMWGISDFFYAEREWTAFNAGVFMIRNCQWTLDLIDKWSPMGPQGPVRDAYGKVLTAFLKGRNDWEADDQSALGYLMITDDAVKTKIKLVESHEYMISGWWVPLVEQYEGLMEKYHPGLGNQKWPWITHFTGCGPCHQDDTTPHFKTCMKNFHRAFHFSDNQVMAYMGFQHESLESPELIRLRNETDRPLEFLGVSPWAERITELAAAEITS